MYIHSFMNMLTVACSLCLCVLFSPYISVFYSSFQAAIFNKFELRSVVFFVISSASIFSANKRCILDVLIATLKPHNNGPLYRYTAIGTLAVDGCAVTFGTARRGLGGLRPNPVPSSLYQCIQCGTIIMFARLFDHDHYVTVWHWPLEM